MRDETPPPVELSFEHAPQRREDHDDELNDVEMDDDFEMVDDDLNELHDDDNEMNFNDLHDGELNYDFEMVDDMEMDDELHLLDDDDDDDDEAGPVSFIVANPRRSSACAFRAFQPPNRKLCLAQPNSSAILPEFLLLGRSKL